MNIVAIGGEPATGKTTLVKRLIAPYTAATPFEWGTLHGLQYDAGLFLLGRYGNDTPFGGTDRLSMSVIDDAEDFLTHAASHPDYTDWTILFEGDRLYNERFLTHAHTTDTATLHAYLLTAPPAVLDARHAQREDDQSDSWLKGRRTKYENLLDATETDATPFTIRPLPHETPDHLDTAVDTITAHLPPPT